MEKHHLLFIALICLGILLTRFYIYQHNIKPYENNEKLALSISILNSPVVQGNMQRFTIEPAGRPKLVVVTKQYPELSYGQEVRLDGKVSIRTLDNKRVFATMYFPEITQGDESFISEITQLRLRVKAFFIQTLPPIPASLLFGIVFGGKESLPTAFRDDLKQAGVMHVVAASGMNVSMVAAAISLILSHFLRRQIALVITIGCILLYMVLAGLEPSIVRASIMASIAFSASLFGRQQFALFSLLLTAFAMLFFDPSLLSDIGFQLSFFATCGILLLKPLMPFQMKRDELGEMRSSNIFVEDFTTTLTAQIATLPLLLGTFGEYGLLSVVTNMLVLWTIPPLMALGGIASLVSFLLPPVAGFVLFLALPLLLYFEMVVSWMGQFNLLLQLPEVPITMAVGYYLMLISLVILKKKQK